MKFEQYKNAFPSPATNSWKYEFASGGSTSVVTPNNYKFQATPYSFAREGFWDEIYQRQHSSTRLWVRSLWYCTELAERGEFKTVKAALASYLEFLQNRDLNPKKFGMNSLDHCLGLNVRTCVYLILFLREFGDQEDILALAETLLADLFTVIKNYDFFLKNNHGLMLTLGLLHGIHASNRTDLPFNVKFCLDFLDDTFNDVVDESGYVYENTPVYQRLWITWASEVSKTLTLLFDLEREARIYQEISEKILSNFQRFIIDKNQALPIGDGTRYISSSVSPVSGFYFNGTGGQTLWNDGIGSVFSYIAGTKSAVHKHADDLSLRWWIDSTEVFADAGAFSYDLSDPVSRCVTSQRGHTGLFFPKFDSIPGPKMYPWDEHDRFVSATSTSSIIGSRIVVNSAKYHTTGEVLQRVVHFDTERNELELIDSASAADSNDIPIARFLIPSSFSVSQNGNQIQASNKQVELIIEIVDGGAVDIHRAIDLSDLDALRNKDDSEIRGIVALSGTKLDSCNVIEIKLSDKGNNFWQSRINARAKTVRPVVFYLGSKMGQALLTKLPDFSGEKIISLDEDKSVYDGTTFTKPSERTPESSTRPSSILSAFGVQLPDDDTRIKQFVFDFLGDVSGVRQDGSPLLSQKVSSSAGAPPVRKGTKYSRGQTLEETRILLEHCVATLTRSNSQLVLNKKLAFLEVFLTEELPEEKTIQDPFFSRIYREEVQQTNLVLEEIYKLAKSRGMVPILVESPESTSSNYLLHDDMQFEIY